LVVVRVAHALTKLVALTAHGDEPVLASADQTVRFRVDWDGTVMEHDVLLGASVRGYFLLQSGHGHRRGWGEPGLCCAITYAAIARLAVAHRRSESDVLANWIAVTYSVLDLVGAT
jgi:hypothetical protein